MSAAEVSPWAVPSERLPDEDGRRADQRTVTLTPASAIRVRPVHWLWHQRIALGTLALLGGREGIGKSTVAYTLAADVTRGRMPGRHCGSPKAVIVAATEDSWEHTIVPRLMGADADLERVFRVDVATADGVDTALSLPRDLRALERIVGQVDAALILLDPLMSRLDAALDTHKDSEVRQALEPLVSVADRTGAAILGLIHVSKAHSTDPLTVLMGSRAFAAVARAVLFVLTDPDEESVRLLGQPKNNLGAVDLPTMTFRIESAKVADTPDGEVWTGKVTWLDDRKGSIRDALEASNDTAEVRGATSEAADWLRDHLLSQGGTDDSADVKAAAAKAGHSPSAVKRALNKIGGISESYGFPRRSRWSLPSRLTPGESEPIELTGLTGLTGVPVGSVSAVRPVESPPARGEPTAGDPRTCPTCGTATAPSRLGHRTLCRRCSFAEVDGTAS